jgi:poly(A) RNA polymerase
LLTIWKIEISFSLQFDEISGCKEALKNASFDDDNPAIPVISPFLWFKARDSSKTKGVGEYKDMTSLIHQEIKCLDESELHEILSSAESIDHQILILHRLTQLNELGIRIRYLASHQLKWH